MNIFYQSNTQWFENVANGCIWALIVAFTAFVVWVGHDLITGPRRQRQDVERMLTGLGTTQGVAGIAPATTLNTHKTTAKTRPFGPKPKVKRDDLTVKS